MISLSLILSHLGLVASVLIQSTTPSAAPPMEVEFEIQTPHWPPSRDLMIADMHFVVLPLEGDPLADPIASGVTGPKGRTTIKVPMEAVRIGKDGNVWANVFLREEGKQSRRASHLSKRNFPGGRANNAYMGNLLSIKVHIFLQDGGLPWGPSGHTIDSKEAWWRLHSG